MLFPEARPGESGAKKTWTWTDLKPDENWTAWVAGPCRWVHSHFIGQHKPCKELMTNGGLTCPLDHSVRRLELVGYLPLYDESHKPVVITVKEHTYDLIQALKPFQHVRVLKSDQKKPSISVVPSLKGPKFATSIAWQQRPANIEAWLLVFWKDADLRNWFAENRPQRVQEDDAPVPEAVEGAARKGKADPMYEAAHRRVEKRALVAPLPELKVGNLGEHYAALGKGETNGKPH